MTTTEPGAAPAAGPSLQDRLAPRSICFGCGPANAAGLRIKSYRHEGGLRTVFRPRPEHQAFAGVINGGILGTLVDCHGNWTAAMALMEARGASDLPATVTAWFEVRLESPTPAGADLVVTSTVREVDAAEGRVTVDVAVTAGGGVTVRGAGRYVEVPEGHPAFHRWE